MSRQWLSGAIAVALAVSVGACSGGSSGEATIPPGAPPQEIAELAGLDGVHSGDAEANLIVTKLKKNEAISFRVNGSFKRLNEGASPELFMAASSQGQWNGHSADFNSSATVLPDKAAIAYGQGADEKSYQIEPSSFDGLRSKLDQARSEGGEGDLAACLEAAQGFDFARLLRAPKIEDHREESDGTKVVIVAGDLVISRLRSLFVELARDPDCAAQMKALGLPPAAQLETARVDFKKGFGGPRLTLAVDRHGVVHELSTRFECARLNGEFFELQLDFNLREVNRPIEVSDSVEGDSLSDLLRRLGTSEEAALKARGSEAVIAFLEGLGGALVGRRQ
jgi:hypothetical protein